ncbi:MAG: CHAD domain-containing protein [Hyphomicrobiaceae bacterium]|nr:CHAD domain-containing protein [Hyphomicrobiaceae bacterium]
MKRLAKAAAAKALRANRPRSQSLDAVFFDTADGRLAQAGISLQMCKARDHWVQTLTFRPEPGETAAPLVVTTQKTTRAKPQVLQLPASPTRTRLLSVVSKKALRPIATMALSRSTRLLRANGEGRIALEIDRGTIRRSSSSAPVGEARLKLMHGRAAGLLAVAESLLSAEPITILIRSGPAGSRGPTLPASVNDSAVPTPQVSRVPRLSRAMTGLQALSALGHTAAIQILHNWEVVLRSDDPEGAHQLRVGLRRLRTALHGAKPLTRDERLVRLRAEAKRLGAIVGALRDADVLLQEVVAPAFAAEENGASDSILRARLTDYREHQRRIVRRELESPDWSWLKLNCALFDCAIDDIRSTLEDERQEGRVLAHARHTLQASWRKAKAWGRDIDHLTIDERHEMRKALKHLRYSIEFYASLYPRKATSEFVKRLKTLQDIFGYLNDVAMSEQLAGILSQSEDVEPRLQDAIHAVGAWHEKRASKAWKRAKARWRDLDETPRFWK